MADAKKIAGVIGWPVSHSLSPRLHGYWLKHYNIEGEYKAVTVLPDELDLFIKSLPDHGWQGCNITLPHKEAVLPLLDSMDEVAKAIGAVNTIVVENGLLRGTNTDAFGFSENIRPHITGKNKAVMLGAGGAAKAICYALEGLGFKEIIAVNRTKEKSDALAAQFVKVKVGEWDKRAELLAGADLLVNTTSLGMTGKEALDIDLALLPKSALVTDIVYTPLMTPLLEAAKARGNPVVDGLGMLLYQAVPGFEAWFGVKPEVTPELREHVLA